MVENESNSSSLENEKIVFRLSKSLWDQCKERDKKEREREVQLLEKIEAKEAELAYHKNLVLQSLALNALKQETEIETRTDLTSCPSCFRLPQGCVCSLTNGKRGRKRKLADEKLTHQKILSHLIKRYDTLSDQQLHSYVKSEPFEQFLGVIPALTNQELICHLISVRVEYVQRLMRPIVQKLISHPRNSDIFNHPVDPESLGLKDYFVRISRPMDLGTVRSKLLRGDYHTLDKCVADVNLVFDNAIVYNPPSHIVHQNAILLRNEFIEDMHALEDRLSKEEEKKSQHCCDVCLGSMCLVCGERCLKLEPTILVCCGPCGQRIKKQGTYFISVDGSLLWCQKCYSGANSVIVESYESDHSPLLKKDLLKRKFDEEVVETWVECSTCSRRIHQACGLYNNLHDVGEVEARGGHSHSYQCPLCKVNLSSLEPKKKMRQKSLKGSVKSLPQIEFQQPPVADSAPFLKFEDLKSNSQFLQENTYEESSLKKHGIQGQCTGSSDTSNETVDQDQFPTTNIDSDGSGPENEVNEDCESEIGDLDAMLVVNAMTDVEVEEDGVEEKSIIDKTSSSSFPAETCPRKPGRSRRNSKRSEVRENVPLQEKWKASCLPRTKLTDFIEAMVSQRLINCGFEEVAKTLTIRMTSNCFHNFEVPEVITENLPTNDGYHVNQCMYYKQKCILLFQNIDGIDVCLFCLYVQEFDENCPEPNKSKVYIAYLDSVEYFRPRCVRTAVYHEILVAYLKWCQSRGFKQAHIWACPPQRGDNFIFWCHNPQQRNPSRDRLNSWYNTMLVRAGNLGIIKSIDTLWTTYFAAYGKRDEASQRTASKNSFVTKNSKTVPNLELPPPICPPIFEGDFWVNECCRVYRIVNVRAHGVDGQDKNINQRKCRDLLKQLMSKPIAVAFNQPVDPVLLNIPDYPSIVKEPMDLGTVRNKLRTNEYKSILEFANEVRRTFNNAMLYNPQGHPIHIYAKKLLEDFEQSINDIVTERLGEVLTLPTEVDRILDTYPLLSIGRNSCELENPPPAETKSNLDTPGCLTRRVSFVDSDVLKQTPNYEVGDGMDILDRHEDEQRCEPEENDGMQPCRSLTRQESTDSCLSMNESWSRRPDFTNSHVCSSNDNRLQESERKPFEKSQLGQKGVMSLMSELSRNVCRLKDDMYVITFQDPSISQESISSQPPLTSESISNMDDDLTKKVVETSSLRGGKGKGKGLSVIGSLYHANQKDMDLDESIHPSCLQLLECLRTDTSDPDELMNCPFLDSRQTFLEMCQYRHYQFDSLRRAKYSSIMLLHHMLYPQSKSTRLVCSECGEIITHVRWHCTLCLASDYDVCGDCLPTAQQHHEHELTPVRLTYI